MTFDDGAETKYDGSFMQGLFAGQGKLFSAARGLYSPLFDGSVLTDSHSLIHRSDIQWAVGRWSPGSTSKGGLRKEPAKGPTPELSSAGLQTSA